ncbi:Light-harvesting complex-like protein OHP1, chloroplastic [Clarias magur]|uniref:Light-harvesting complex-like protein OHP1, chloroplastic n=1 Tax=Clarias magur TaxID=1594786 RepID=A0A8J4WUM9_CLAMG|nr:Light-harvesting complex-like protein OHP1, chloroplastic [Clarias magur]
MINAAAPVKSTRSLWNLTSLVCVSRSRVCLLVLVSAFPLELVLNGLQRSPP